MKILHCSDLHLGRRPVGGPNSEFSNIRYDDYFNAFRKIAEYSIDKNIEVMMISGDVFDKKEIRPDVLSNAMDIFKMITDAGTEIFLIEGNHDKGFLDQETWLKYVAREDKIKFLDSYKFEGGNRVFEPEEYGGFNFYGLGYPGSLVNDIMEGLADNISGENNIIMVHTDLDVSGQEFFPGLVKKEIVDKFKDKCTYIAGGHIHFYHKYPKENPFFFVPGCPEYWDIKEKKDRGFIVFDTQTGTHEFISSEGFRRKKIDLKYRVDEETSEEFKSNLDTFIEAKVADVSDNAPLITLELYVENPRFGIYTEEIENLVEKQGALKSSVSINRTKPENMGTDKKERHVKTTAEIENEIIRESESWQVFGHVSDDMVRLLETMKRTQIENDYDKFSENLDKLLSGMVEEVNKDEDK